MKFCLVLSLVLAAAFGLPCVAQAQDKDSKASYERLDQLKKEVNDLQTVEQKIKKRVQLADDNNYLSLSVENDLFGGGDDQNYTSGVRLTYFDIKTPMPPIVKEMAEAIPTFDINDTTSTFFSVGQNIFTPENITIAANQPDDRPYAGWLYGSVGLTTVTKNHLDELEFTLGVVGPESLAENTQKLIHNHISDSPSPKGWGNQLEFEPGAIISWQRRWPVWYTQNIGKLRMRVEPNVNVSLGNVYTYAGSGATVTLGPYKDRLQDTPPRVRPAMAGTGFFDTPDKDFSWYVFAGVDGRAMARNIFLDGNTFKDSNSVDKKYLVGDANAGLALTYDDYRLAYTLNYRTIEFDTQDDPSVFGSLTLSTRF